MHHNRIFHLKISPRGVKSVYKIHRQRTEKKIRVVGQWEWHYEVGQDCQWKAQYNVCVRGHKKIIWGVCDSPGVKRKESQG